MQFPHIRHPNKTPLPVLSNTQNAFSKTLSGGFTGKYGS
jgi:hypothetical protein